MNGLEARFLEKLGSQWQTATPGLKVQAYSRGKKIVDVELGKTYPYYDWASLTKLVFTTTALMFEHDEKAFKLTDNVARFVSWVPKSDGIRMKDLLSHSAGLAWWYPFFKEVSRKTEAKYGPRATPEEAWGLFEGILRRRVLKDLKERSGVNSADSRKAVYSDLDFFLLGLALENMNETALYVVWSALSERIGFRDVDFQRGNKPAFARKCYAPTEKDPWRGRLIQGEAHDENTWSLKGVAPHAGLFGPIDELSRWGLLLRKAMRGVKTRHFPSPETVRLFTRRSLPRSRGDWGLGFMMPTKGSASCGDLFSLNSVGHTGFTGTSLWYDPERDLLVTLLSNRVCPTRENREFLTLRPKIHTWIAEEL